MEHKLIQGGEQYLPFARSRIKALRATGLNYASEKILLPDGEVRVRIVGRHSYIELSGTQSGFYLVLPANDTYPSGDTVGATVPAVAAITINKDATLKVDDHSILESAHVNWKSGNKFVSYNHGIKYRYRIDRLAEDVSLASQNIYFNGAKYLTGGHGVAGAGIFRTEINGSSVRRFIIFTPISPTLVIAYAAPLGSNTWVEIGRINVSGGGAVNITEPSHTVVSGNVQSTVAGADYAGRVEDPWFMDPNGNNAISLITSDSTRVKRVVRCSIAAVDEFGVITLTATFAVGEHVGAPDNQTVTLESLGTTSATTQPSGTFTRTCHTAFTNIHGSFVPGDEVIAPMVREATQYNDYVGIGLLPSQTPYTSTYLREEVVGVDYSAAGEELFVYRRTTIADAGRPNTFNGNEGSGGTHIDYDWFAALPAGVERGLILSGVTGFTTDVDGSLPAYFNIDVTRSGSRVVSIGYYVGDVKIFDVPETTGFSYSYLNADAGDTENFTDVDQSVLSRLAVYSLDARDRSAIYEHMVQTVDTDPDWNHLTTAENLAVRSYTMKSTAKVVYKSVEVLSQDLEAITPFDATGAQLTTAGATGHIFVRNSPSVIRGITWDFRDLNTPNYANPPEASMASRKTGEFIASMKFKQTAFGAKLAINSASYIANPSTIQLIKKDTTTLGTVELNKIPLHGPTGYFRMMPVCVV